MTVWPLLRNPLASSLRSNLWKSLDQSFHGYYVSYALFIFVHESDIFSLFEQRWIGKSLHAVKCNVSSKSISVTERYWLFGWIQVFNCVEIVGEEISLLDWQRAVVWKEEIHLDAFESLYSLKIFWTHLMAIYQENTGVEKPQRQGGQLWVVDSDFIYSFFWSLRDVSDVSYHSFSLWQQILSQKIFTSEQSSTESKNRDWLRGFLLCFFLFFQRWMKWRSLTSPLTF